MQPASWIPVELPDHMGALWPMACQRSAKLARSKGIWHYKFWEPIVTPSLGLGRPLYSCEERNKMADDKKFDEVTPEEASATGRQWAAAPG